MSRMIFKYPIEDEGVIVEAVGQMVVLVGFDPKIDKVCVWVEQKPPKDGKVRRRQYLIQGTGWGMDDEESFHVGSAITPDGYVWHVYGRDV